MTDEYNQDLCSQKHSDMERRMSHIETQLTTNLEKLYTRIEDLSGDMTLIAMKRLPVWTTVTISFLSATCVGLIVAVVK